MKKASKIVALIMCTTMIIGLTACGKSTTTENTAPTVDTSSTGDAEVAKPAADANTASADKVQLSYAFWGGEDEIKAAQAALDEFNGSQDRIEVTAMPIPWETYMEKLNTMATGKSLPDVAMMNEAGVIQWAEQDMLLDVSEMYEAGQGPLESLHFTYDGKPVAYSSANEILMLFYNKDMFDAAGIDYPPLTGADAWNWDEFVEVAKKLTLDVNGKTPNDAGFDKDNIVQYGCMVENLTWQLEVWALSNGGGFYSKDGKSVTITDPAAIEAIQKVADLYLVHHVAPLSTGLTDDGVPRSVVAGTVAMTTNGAWNMGTCLASARDEGLNYGIGVLPYMKEKVTITTGGPTVVFETTEHPEEAMEFVRWYTSPDNNWGLIENAIWMPTLETYYTDEKFSKEWLENPNFPAYEEAKPVLVDYTREYSRPTAWYYVNNTVDFNDLLNSILGDVWTGKATAEEAITGAASALESAFKGM